MKIISISFFLLTTISVIAQTADESAVRQIYSTALTKSEAYSNLEYLTTKIGQRLSGSPGAQTAVEWTKKVMEDYGFDSVWLQPVMVPHWVRGQKEIGRIVKSKKGKPVDVNICALGGSIGTGPKGITASVVEVKSLKELADLGTKNLQGKIVFFNRPMDPKEIDPFAAYGGAVDQRGRGAAEAVKYGAVAVLVRSMGVNVEDYPHTGGMRYEPNGNKIPAMAISTKDANLLSASLKDDKGLQFYLEAHCEMLDDAPSFNVIGEIKGGEYKDEIIVVGGHLDSWDLGQGAHDDGSGCVQAIEALRIFNNMGYKPKRTLRAVMFMNEENGLRGGTKYAELATSNKEKHIAAMESDRGGFAPRGFTMTASDSVRKKIMSWRPVLEPYGLYDFAQEGGGADIGPLGRQGVPVMEYFPDPQRYFSYHHTKEDTFDKIDKRELELGAAAMAAMIYLIDKYGLK